MRIIAGEKRKQGFAPNGHVKEQRKNILITRLSKQEKRNFNLNGYPLNADFKLSEIQIMKRL
jgi:hypothetical protein